MRTPAAAASRAPGKSGRLGGVELDPDAAPLRHLVRVAEQAEARHVGDRVRVERPQHVGRLAAEDRHRPHRRLEPLLVTPSLARGVEEHPRPERLRQEERIARPRAALRPVAVRVHGADDGEPVLRLVVAQRVAAGEDPAGRAHLLVGGAEDRGERLVRQALRKGGDREREQRRAAHREDVVERVRRRDAPEERGIVDERREEVEREDERALVVELVDDRRRRRA